MWLCSHCTTPLVALSVKDESLSCNCGRKNTRNKRAIAVCLRDRFLWELFFISAMVMSPSWLCFSCCVTQQPPPRRPRIDRSMIGEPMNFQHTGHIGSGEVQISVDLNDVTYRMKSKGGYQENSVDSRLTPNGIEINEGSPAQE